MPPGIGDPTATTDPGVVINGIRWATRNLDYPGTFAPYPHSAGRFYQWGRRIGVTNHWPATGPVTGWNDSNDRTAWTAANDPCPPGWRMPTRDQLISLNNAIGGWTQQEGVNGRLFGTAPNQIFLPAAGARHSANGVAVSIGTLGLYWSSSALTTTHAWFLRLPQDESSVSNTTRANGFSIRCVSQHI